MDTMARSVTDQRRPQPKQCTGFSRRCNLAAPIEVDFSILPTRIIHTHIDAEKGSGTNSAKHPKGRSGYWFLTPFCT